ncbi:hypothetical protein D9615_007873 [Tricholomella constricta]|uniref:Uncharacterized protein n=1 Tax=Tricholomella constricta TaxID=117010 RepID=A0A8H5H4I0_9AGAR|nr:hypothetical protein D9615_007873 [Tricholomella constricta]
MGPYRGGTQSHTKFLYSVIQSQQATPIYSTPQPITMDVFNPKILDASIRDVSSCLTDNQKVDLLLYAMRSLHPEGRSRTIIENAVQSCLLISTLSSENTAKARILRARARLAVGSHFGAQEGTDISGGVMPVDLQAALVAEPDNPEAKALLHQRSVTVEKLLSPLPRRRDRFSVEIWREIALHLPRHDLKALLFIPHAVSRVASQLLFRKLDLHFGGIDAEEGRGDLWTHHSGDLSFGRDEDARHAQRSADILTRIIIDPSFASAVRTLRIYAPMRDRDGAMAFQTGMLTNALPKLVNLRNVHISAGVDGILPVLRVMQTCTPRLRGLSLHSPDGPTDLQSFEFKHLAHFSYTTSGGSTNQVQSFLAQNRDFVRTVYIDNPHWIFPTNSVSIRNLTHFHFTGHVPQNNQLFADIIANGRQLESLTLCCSLDGATSQQFRALHTFSHTHGYGHPALPFLRHFAFSVHAVHRRVADRDLFPAIAEFLRGRQHLQSLVLTVHDETVQRAVGFDAAVWGVLPSLTNLRGLKITYPPDLSPGLASWLIPRSVLALALTLDHVPSSSRDPVPFLEQLRAGIPHTLRYVGLPDLLPLRNISVVVGHGFPMVRVVRVGNSYFSVARAEDGAVRELEPCPKRTVAYHCAEWLEWRGCEDACSWDPSEFPS